MKRCPNGSKARIDGKGSFFGNEHRFGLKSQYPMHDIDGMWLDVEDRVYAEFVTNETEKFGIEILGNDIRCATLALFDYKDRPRQFAHDDDCNSYLRIQAHFKWICNFISLQQFLPCRFFHVYGVDYPLEVVEQDTHKFTLSDNTLSTFTIQGRHDWLRVWRALGMCGDRHALKQWLIMDKTPKRVMQ